jgi:hypothetical protein
MTGGLGGKKYKLGQFKVKTKATEKTLPIFWEKFFQFDSLSEAKYRTCLGRQFGSLQFAVRSPQCGSLKVWQ